MKNNATLPIVLLLSLFCAAACKNYKEDPPVGPAPISCTGGYVPQNDSCVCPVGNYEGYGTCRALRPNEFWGIGYGFICQDTVSMWFHEGRKAGNITIKFSGRGPGVKRKMSHSTWSAKYFVLPDGDSLIVDVGFLTPCNVGGGMPEVFAEPSATGKFTHPDTLKMTLYWHHVHFPFPVLDTSQIIFHR